LVPSASSTYPFIIWLLVDMKGDVANGEAHSFTLPLQLETPLSEATSDVSGAPSSLSSTHSITLRPAHLHGVEQMVRPAFLGSNLLLVEMSQTGRCWVEGD
jgi:hypothetical protein